MMESWLIKGQKQLLTDGKNITFYLEVKEMQMRKIVSIFFNLLN